jgi:aminoglycoside/choline kinase family phosphotransferase
VTAAAPDPADEALRALGQACLGSPVARVEPVGGGIGHRAFHRLYLADGRTAIARTDRGEPAPGVLPEPPLEPLRSFLEAHGLPVPRRLGGSADGEIDLLEDAGSTTLEDVAARAASAVRRPLYEEACDGIARLQRLPDPGDGTIAAFGRALDAPTIALKAARFARSGLPAVLGRAPTPTEVTCVRAAFEAVAAGIAEAPRRLAHRDFQSRNLMVRPPGAGARGRLVWIDLQGAFLAPPEYDLVCLLRDSYVSLGDDEWRSLAERARRALPDAPDPATFARRFDLLTVTRKAKDFALCHELAARGDASWLRFAPATLAYVREALSRTAAIDPRLAALAALLGGSACAR